MKREAKLIAAEEVGRDSDLTVPRSLDELSKNKNPFPNLKKDGSFLR